MGAIALTALFTYGASPKLRDLSQAELHRLVGELAIDGNGSLIAKLHNGTDKRITEIVVEVTTLVPRHTRARSK
jgi:hypothetical protein